MFGDKMSHTYEIMDLKNGGFVQKYQCMVCKKIYYEGHLPVIDKENQRGDGCCTIGSLIELKKEV